MNGLEIDSIVRSIPDTQKYWAGVFSSDTMPIRKIPYCFITNTAASHEVGDHWTAFFVDKNVEFFDSYGRAPTNVMFPSSFTDFIRSRDCFYSTVMVEGLLAKTCGQFCIYYTIKRCRGFTFEEIIKTFSSNPVVNDKIVSSFVKWI